MIQFSRIITGFISVYFQAKCTQYSLFCILHIYAKIMQILSLCKYTKIISFYLVIYSIGFNYMQVIIYTCNNRPYVRTLLYYIIYRCKDFLLFAFIDIFMCFVFVFSLLVYFICEKRKNALPLHQKSIKI